MSRSARGCWTCRLRHVKCDETHPICRICSTRDITCHGYGKKPEWLDGGVLELSKAAEIRSTVKANLARMRRQKSKRRAATTLSSSLDHSPGEVGVPGTPAYAPSATTASPSRIPCACDDQEPIPSAPEQPATGLEFGHTTFTSNLAPTIPHSNTYLRSSTIPTETSLTFGEVELLMYYLDHVFPLEYRFYEMSMSYATKGWLAWLVVRSGPLRHAILTLAALHKTARLGQDVENGYAQLTSHHGQTLKDLQLLLQRMQRNSLPDVIGQQIEIAACGVSLISFELFQGGGSNWPTHLNAITSLPLVSDVRSVQEVIACDQFHTLPRYTDQSRALLEWQSPALSFLISVVVWFDLLACASTGEAPRTDYTALLAQQLADPGNVMGCQNWVMENIGDLATLNAWKMQKQQTSELSVRELVTRSREIEQRLQQGLERLEIASLAQTPVASDNVSGEPSLTAKPSHSTVVTRVFAAGALVQLHTIESGSYSALPEVRAAVARSRKALETINDPEMVRGLIWPVCISACMAEVEHRNFFEELVTRSIGELHGVGNCHTILDIMKECWRMRDTGWRRGCDWRDGMESLQMCALLA